MRKFLNKAWRVVKPIGAVLLGLIILLALVIIPAETGSTPHVQRNLASAAGWQVQNFQDAGGSPLPGDASATADELACVASTPNTGMYRTLSPAEGIDAQRSNSSPCATFLGDFSNPSNNTVLAYQSPDRVGGSILDAVTGKPGELFVYCCGGADQASYGVNQGHTVAKLNAQTLQIEWTTPLDNWDASGQWNVLAGINYEVGPSGKPALMVSYGHSIAKIDPNTGDIIANLDLPVGTGTDPTVVSYETTIPTPDGIVVTKTQTRPATTESDPSSPPCTAQGFTAMINCKGKPPNSQVTAIDPDTMTILDSITLPTEVGGRNTIGVYQGHTYIYMTGSTNEVRVEWDPVAKKLSYDKDWYPAYLLEGQSGGAGPCVLGNWVLFNTNAGPADVSPSIVAINQGNPNDLHRITAIPIGDAKQSLWPSKLACDPETNTIYEADTGIGKIAAVTIDPSTGEMKQAWGPVDQRTFGFFTAYGPKDQRVVLSSNINLNNPLDVFGVGDTIYGEQFVWREAATGKEIARSNYYGAMTQGILPTPGYGGIMYMLQADGGVVATQVVKESGG